MTLVHTDLATPAGTLRLVADGAVAVHCAFLDPAPGPGAGVETGAGAGPEPTTATTLDTLDTLGSMVGTSPASERVAAYLAGDLDAIDGIEVTQPGTDFQRRVWDALRTIPAGTTWSYRDLAEAVGSPRAVRAVGQANGRNAVAVIVPCHRVVAADGTLGGYAGGLDRKHWLLDHERALPAGVPAELPFGATAPGDAG